MAKRIIALLLTCLLVAPCLSVFAAGEEPEYLVAETFENYVTNGKPENGSYTAQEYRVIDEGNGNKAVSIRSNDETFINVSFSFGAQQIPTQFVVSMDVRRIGTKGTGKLAVNSPYYGKTMTLLSIAEDGSIYDPSGYHVGGLNSLGTRLTFICNIKDSVYSVYINDKAVCKNWYFRSDQIIKDRLESLIFSFAPKDGETELIIDNLYLYGGLEILHPKKSSPTKTIFNNAVLPYIPEEEPEEDVNPDGSEKDDTKVFFVRTFEEPAMDPWFGWAVRPEEAGELRTDVDGRKYLYTYFDAAGRLDFIPSSNQYSRVTPNNRYVIAQFDITGKVFDGTGTQLFNIANRSDNVDSNFVTLKGNTLTASNGTVVGTLREGTWNNIAIAMDFVDHTYDVYFDFELVQADIPFLNARLSNVTMWYVQNIVGELIIDNICLYTGKAPKPMDHNSYPKVSYLDADNANIEVVKGLEILNLNNGRFYYKGDLVSSNEPMFIEKDGSYYMNAAKIAEAYDVTYSDEEGDIAVNDRTLADTVTEDGIVYAQYQELLEDALGRKTLYDGRGMIIAYEGVLNTDAYGVEGNYGMWDIFDYTNYDRPTAEELITLYQEKSAGTHPRLIYSRAEVDAVKAKAQTNEKVRKLYNQALASAEGKFGFVPTEYVGSSWARTSEFNYIYPLAKAYLLSGDAKFAEEAWKHVEYIINTWKNNWFGTDNLAHSHAESGVAIFYDWCYDWLTPDKRTRLEDEMLRNGLAVADATYYSRASNGQYHWVNSDLMNQMPVTNSGHILAAICLMDREPEYAADVLATALRAMENYGTSFYPGGAYIESMTYYVYGMQYYQRLVSSLLTTFDDDFGLLDIPSIGLSPYYLVHLSTMLGSNNYHDSEGGTITAYLGGLSWLSHVLEDPTIETIRKTFSEVTNDSGADIFYSNFSDEVGEVSLPLDAKFAEIEIASMRSGFASTQDTWLSFHGGAALPDHGHLDTGVYVLEMLGERFVYDMGSEDYGFISQLNADKTLKAEMDEYEINDQSPWLYRRNTEGHNCVVINPRYAPMQNPHAFAPITRFESKARGAIGVLDMTETYSFDARKATRGYLMGDDRRSVTVRDEITVLKPDSEVYSFIYTKADVEIVDNTSAIFTMNGKKVLVRFLTDGTDPVLEAGEAKPLPQTPQLMKKSTDGFTKISFRAKTDGDIFIQTKYIPLSDPNVSVPLENIPIDQWTIPDGEIMALPELQNIRYNGETREPFNADQTSQIYKLPAGSNVPAIEAVYDASLYSCETVQAESLQDSATITLRYLSDPSIFRTYTVSFVELTQQPDYQGYELLQVYDVDSSYDENETSGFKNNLVDGDITTMFATHFDEGTTIWMDLGSPQRIEALAMGVGYGDTRSNTFELQMSNDMKEWTRVDVITTTPTLDMVIYPLSSPVTARYIRLIPITCSNSTFFNTSEFYAARLR